MSPSDDITKTLEDMEKVFEKARTKRGGGDLASDVLESMKTGKGADKKSKSTTYYLDSRTESYLEEILNNTPDIKSRSQALSYVVDWHRNLHQNLQDFDNRIKAMDQKLELMTFRTEKLGAQSNKLALLQNSLSQTSLDAKKVLNEVSQLVRALSKVKKLNKEDVILQEIKELKENIANMSFVSAEGGGGTNLNLQFKGKGQKLKGTNVDVDASSDLLSMF
jgi:chromosome segregation ATPase